MHMGVTQAGDHIAPLRLDDSGFRAGAMGRVRPDKGDAAFGNRHRMVGQGFAGVNVDPDAAADHGIGVFATGGDGDQAGGHVGPAREKAYTPWPNFPQRAKRFNPCNRPVVKPSCGPAKARPLSRA